VATVKPSTYDPTKPSILDASKHGIHYYPARFTSGGMPLKFLFAIAYDTNMTQIAAPGWMEKQPFDIEARFPKRATKDDVPKMLQALLKERFNLAFHVEKKEGKVYALIVGKHGAKLKPALPDSPQEDASAPLKPGEQWVGEGEAKHKKIINKDGSNTIDMGKRGTWTQKFDWQNKTAYWERSKITMEEFAAFLPSILIKAGEGQWKIVDQTGIKGEYHVALNYKLRNIPNKAENGDAFDPLGDGSLNRSLSALGLRLEIQRALIERYVIDHAEKPSADAD